MGNGKGGEESRWEENRGEDGSLEGNRRRVRKRDGMGKGGKGERKGRKEKGAGGSAHKP